MRFGATPWAAAAHVATELPTTFEGWGPEVDAESSLDAQDAVFDLGPTPIRYVLVAFEQLARDSGCSDSNPYRGRISEITFQPTP